MTLTWEVPQKDGGSPITGYIVERCQQPGSRWVKVNKKPVPDTMYTVPDLIENTDYKFRVAAENSVGVGKPSEPTSSITVKQPYGKFFKKYKIIKFWVFDIFFQNFFI